MVELYKRKAYRFLMLFNGAYSSCGTDGSERVQRTLMARFAHLTHLHNALLTPDSREIYDSRLTEEYSLYACFGISI